MPLISDTRIDSIVVAGAGGFGLEVLDYLQAESARGGPPVVGFIDDTPADKIADRLDLPLLGTILDYQPPHAQAVILAIGNARARETILTRLWQRGVKLPTWVHSNALVSAEATLGKAAIVAPFSIVSRRAALGNGVVINVHCTIGHGASVGEYSVLSPYAALNGDAAVGTGCFLGTRATIYPRVHIGSRCVVDSHTGVKQSAGDRRIISTRSTYLEIDNRLG